MKITIKTKDTDISMPVPLAMADMAIRTVPDKVFRKAAEKAWPAIRLPGQQRNDIADIFGMQRCFQRLQRPGNTAHRGS